LVGIRSAELISLSRQCIPAHIYPLLKAVKDSVNSLQLSTDPVATRALKAAVVKQLNTHKAAKWDAQLDGLQVQSKFKDNVTLDISGLPSRQCLLCSVLVLTPSQCHLTWLNGKFNQIPIAPYAAHETQLPSIF